MRTTKTSCTTPNKIIYVFIMITLLLGLTGCGSTDNKEMENYFKLKDDFMYFTNNVYNPTKSSDMAMGLSKIRDYVTPQLFEELANDLGEYKEEVKAHIEDLNVSYIRKENSLNSKNNKINITFRLVSGDKSQLYALEFIEDNQNKLSRYNIYTGIIEVK